MQFKVMGKLWRLIWVAKNAAFVTRRDKDGNEQRMSKTDEGLTEGAWLKKKRIFIRHELRGEKRTLETVIHEFTHAADWSKDEAWVTQFGHDLANLLFTLGWRWTEPPEIVPVDEPETLES